MSIHRAQKMMKRMPFALDDLREMQEEEKKKLYEQLSELEETKDYMHVGLADLMGPAAGSRQTKIYYLTFTLNIDVTIQAFARRT